MDWDFQSTDSISLLSQNDLVVMKSWSLGLYFWTEAIDLLKTKVTNPGFSVEFLHGRLESLPH